MFVNSSNLMKDLNLKIQGAQHIQNRKKIKVNFAQIL